MRRSKRKARIGSAESAVGGRVSFRRSLPIAARKPVKVIDMSSVFYAACCQTDFPCPTTRVEIGERTRRMANLVEATITGYEPFFDVRLLAFPEFAHAAPIYDSVPKLLERLAIPVPNEHVDRYLALAKKYGCYIQTGSFLEADPRHPDVVFNSTCLVGPTGVLAKYRKINPWIPWELCASPHDAADALFDPFPVVETELGRLGVAICYDWLFPETIREFAFRGVEIMIRISAYMDPWGATPPMDWWTLFNRTRAAENCMFVVAVNQGAATAHYPPFSWPGGSMIVDGDGRILAQADPGPGEKIVVGPIALETLRQERRRRFGHDTRAHFRSGMHSYARKPWLEPATPQDHPLTAAGIRRRIVEARKRTGVAP